MKTYLIKVDMKDVWEFANIGTDARAIQRRLTEEHPGHSVAVYKLMNVEVGK